jgi:hypothetical protein
MLRNQWALYIHMSNKEARERVCQVEWVFISSQTWHEAPPLQLWTSIYLSVSIQHIHSPLSCQPEKAQKLNSVSLFLLLCSLYKTRPFYITWPTKALELSDAWFNSACWAALVYVAQWSLVVWRTLSLLVRVPPRAALFLKKVLFIYIIFNNNGCPFNLLDKHLPCCHTPWSIL